MKSNTEKITIENTFTDGITGFELLGDPMQYPKFHPLITKVEKLKYNKYLCYETTQICSIPYHFKYKVSVNHPESTIVIMNAEVQKGVSLQLTFTLVNPYKIIEQIEVSGPLLISKIIINKVKKAHRKMFENLHRALDNDCRPFTI